MFILHFSVRENSPLFSVFYPATVAKYRKTDTKKQILYEP
jgi:hypothetical protein